MWLDRERLDARFSVGASVRGKIFAKVFWNFFLSNSDSSEDSLAVTHESSDVEDGLYSLSESVSDSEEEDDDEDSGTGLVRLLLWRIGDFGMILRLSRLQRLCLFFEIIFDGLFYLSYISTPP